jgi:thiamine pyrophosphokinase
VAKILYQQHSSVTLLGAAPVLPDLARRVLTIAPTLFAADGGANTARDLGLLPKAVLGDLDSMNSGQNWRKSGVAIHHIDEQETTDLEKCLYSIDAPLFLCVGFLGGDLDHQLGVLNAMVKYGEKKIVLVGETECWFACPERLEMDLPAGTRVSLFPMRKVVGVLSRGLEWPVAGLEMAPHGRIGISNRMAGERLELGFDVPGMLVMVPGALLDSVIAALSRA